MKVNIYCSTHAPYNQINSNVFKYIQVGKEYNLYDYGVDLVDSIGDNISEKNPYYCELTAQYWVWKNDKKSTHLGFMHYRRHLNFSDDIYDVDNWGCVCSEKLDKNYEEKFGFSEENITQLLTEYDIILPEKWDVRNAGNSNNYDHYKNGEFLHIDDYNEAINIISRKYPEYLPYVKMFNESSLGYYTNIFVMQREHFEKYSEWLFDILEELENNISIGHYGAQERRVIGHVAERLFNIYVEKLIVDEKLNVKELQRTFVNNVPMCTVINKESNNYLPFVICFDDNYAHSGGALIQSIIDHSTLENNYEINVFCDNVSLDNRNKILSLIKNKDNFRIRFINTASLFDSYDMNVSEHFTAATYARLFIPQVFPLYKKVVFIDADMIVLDDVAKLHSVDMKGKKIGAVKDIVTEGFIKFNHPSPREFGDYTSYTYLKEYLGMSDPNEYFQAGLLIMDLHAINSSGIHDDLVNAIYNRNYWYHDQDILNLIFEGDVYFLDMSWNVYHGNGNTDSFFPNLNLSTYLSFLKARENMKIIHFAGNQKPWINPNVDYAELYFNSVNKTPWGFEKNKHLISSLDGSYKLDFNELKRHILYCYNEHTQLNDRKVNQIIYEIFDGSDNKKPIKERKTYVLNRIKIELKILIKKAITVFAPVGSKRFNTLNKLRTLVLR